MYQKVNFRIFINNLYKNMQKRKVKPTLTTDHTDDCISTHGN